MMQLWWHSLRPFTAHPWCLSGCILRATSAYLATGSVLTWHSLPRSVDLPYNIGAGKETAHYADKSVELGVVHGRVIPAQTCQLQKTLRGAPGIAS